MKITEIRSKTDSELDYEIDQLKKELFGLRFRSAGESLTSPSRILGVRRSIARIKTVLHERATGVREQEPK